MKRQLDTAIDFEIIRNLEDDIKAKREQIAKLEDNYKQLEKVGTN